MQGYRALNIENPGRWLQQPPSEDVLQKKKKKKRWGGRGLTDIYKGGPPGVLPMDISNVNSINHSNNKLGYLRC